MKETNKTFRVFISSTFNDFKKERNELQKRVFPKLKKLCKEKGFSFQPVDLRWGVSSEAVLDQKAMKICFEEIKRSQTLSPKPNFISLLGNRYGWNPLPYEIEKDEFEKICSIAKKEDKDFLLNWFKLDLNSIPPVYDLQVRKDIYADLTNLENYNHLKEIKDLILTIENDKRTEENDKLIKSLNSLTKFLKKKKIRENIDNNDFKKSKLHNVFKFLKKNKELNIDNNNDLKKLEEFLKYNEINTWGYIENRLRTILQNNIIKLDDINDEKIQKYFTSATEQEIIKGIFKIKDAESHVHCFFREINNKNEIDIKYFFKKLDDFIENNKDNKKNIQILSDFVELDKKNRTIDKQTLGKVDDLKETIKKHLPKENIHNYSTSIKNVFAKDNENIITEDHIEELCNDVEDALTETILEEINNFKDKDSLQKEIDLHSNFADERSKHFVGRINIIKDIKKYINSNNRSPLVIIGESGSGKTALLSHLSEQLKNNQYLVISRFIGASPESSDIISLLKSISQELTIKYNKENSEIPDNFQEALSTFLSKLNYAKENNLPLIIFIDGLNQLSDIGKITELSWLPKKLPENVNLIVSTTEDASGKIKKLIDKKNIKFLKEMDFEEAKELLKSLLKSACRTLQKHQQKEIFNKLKNGQSPLFLKIAFEELLTWKSYTPQDETILDDTIQEIIKKMFERLSMEKNHGEVLTSKMLSYLASSRYGLAENELIDILSYDKKVMKDYNQRKSEDSPKVDKLPFIVYSRLFSDLEPYLIPKKHDDFILLNFHHHQFKEIIDETYPKDKKENHANLARYFNNLYNDEKESMENKKYELVTIDKRIKEELPWQQLSSELFDDLISTLTDIQFFSELFDTELYDLKHYWNKIEENHGLKIKKAYENVIKNPSKYNKSEIFKLAMFLYNNNDLNEANIFYEYLENKAMMIGDKNLLAVILGNQGAFYYAKNDLDKAIEKFKQQEKISRESLFKNTLQSSLGNQAVILFEQNKMGESMKLSRVQKNICREINHEKGLSRAYGIQGAVLRKQKKYDQSLYLHEKEEMIVRKINNFEGLAVSLFNQSKVYLEIKKYDEALNLLKQANSISKKYFFNDLENTISQKIDEMGNTYF
ncbi:MAG: NACHT domain-containing protein [Methanobrevibacter sp.]|nr:NACHT domain-containing protein [Methanobrevibacter sp.]